MPDLRPETSDARFLRVLRARLEADPAFRESLARVVVADKPTYEHYVERKRHEGGPILPRDEWEVYVFGDTGDARREEGERGRPSQRTRQPRPKRLFSTRETRHLPKWAAQHESHPDKLFEQAREAYPQMLDWLDRGEGVDKKIGARVVRRDRDPDARIDLDREGPVMIIAPNKDRTEAERKVRDRYGGDWREGAVDLVRATIAVDRYDQLQEVVDRLKESGLDLVSQPRNRFREPTEAGYRDVVLNARLPNGHVMEIQLHLKEVLRAKEEAHKEYRRVKGLDDKISGRGRGPSTEITTDELQLFDDATRRMRELYDSAWQQVTTGSEPASIFEEPVQDKARRKRQRQRQKALKRFKPKHPGSAELAKAAQEKAVFYEMDGLPVRWVRPKLPMIEGGDKPYPVDSLVAFAERAVRIDEEAFDDLVEERLDRRGKKAFLDRVRRVAAERPGFLRALKEALSEV